MGPEPTDAGVVRVSVGADPGARIGLGRRGVAPGAYVNLGETLRLAPILLRGEHDQLLLGEFFLIFLEPTTAAEEPPVVSLLQLIVRDLLPTLPTHTSGAHGSVLRLLATGVGRGCNGAAV